ncbi:TetR/AcrR family transcriptional regulator [Herbaspirillum robiniae]|uniref:TetR/AcrR family transcriptional regulator n=1 Tax=Herbaspirillum robiniae TaxID=2014887 RepID=UPI003D774C11
MKSPRRTARADGESTRARILDAAGRLIAAHGYSETTSKAIAAEAAVDLASINYHFGSRQQLYQAVLALAHNHFISLPQLKSLVDSQLSAPEKLSKMIEGIVSHVATVEGWQARVLAREVLAPSVHLKVVFNNEFQPKLALMTGILSEITGIPPSDPALLRCLLSVGGPCLMLMVAGKNSAGPISEISKMPKPDVVKHLHLFAMAGLTAIREQHHHATSTAGSTV